MSETEKIKARMLEKMMKERQKAERKKEMPKKPLIITDENFEEIVSKYPLVVVDVWAPWCGPCKMVAPGIEQLAKEMKGHVVFAKLNTDENQRTATKFRIMAIPTLLLFKDGKYVERYVGALPPDMLRDWVGRYV